MSWLATPFSGMALPWPLRFTMDFCHLQKLSRDFPAWWVISRVGCRQTGGHGGQPPLWEGVGQGEGETGSAGVRGAGAGAGAGKGPSHLVLREQDEACHQDINDVSQT